MEIVKILDIENDGSNMASDGNSLYLRCGKAIHKYNLSDMKMTAHNEIFKKNGKARRLAISKNHIIISDFCDLYVLNKDNLHVIFIIRLGENQSSDITAVHCDAEKEKAYVSIRNGFMAIVDITTQVFEKSKFNDKSAWDFAVTRERLYIGTAGGELFEMDKLDMRIIKTTQLCKPNVNVHSVLPICSEQSFPCDYLLYTMSRDKFIRILKAGDFENVQMVKTPASTSARFLGVYKDYLIMADWSDILLWDKNTLQHYKTFKFPTGYYINGVLLVDNTLYGSDFQSVYRLNVETVI
ncbi:MAG: hypothetical protein LBI19_00300 [Oscillospiraceae bacterium]|jgi:hypothetical protein|nr:hypothetical protein [Oscillospiraceae bacterium]